MHLASCSALSSDHLPVLIDTMCRSSFQNPPDRPDFKRTDWAKFQTHLETEIPSNPELHNGISIDACVENLSGAILKALAFSTPGVARVTTHGLRYRPEFRMKYA